MHKSVNQLPDACVEVCALFTGQILQQKIWGKISVFYAVCANVIRALFTPQMSVFDLLKETYTRFTQALLQELHIKLIKGI